MILNFMDDAHRAFYDQCVTAEESENDACRKALFYCLGLTAESRSHITDLYDFVHHCIKETGLRRGWQTGGSRRVCRLAFNLYNGFGGKNAREALEYTPYFLFDTSLAPYMQNALRLRYPACFGT